MIDPTIRAYSYCADLHCPACTLTAYEAGTLIRRGRHKNMGHDMHGLPYDLLDREGNEIGVVFGHDEVPAEGELCATCFGTISEPQEPEEGQEEGEIE